MVTRPCQKKNPPVTGGRCSNGHERYSTSSFFVCPFCIMIPPDRLDWFFWSRRACFDLSIACRQHTRARSNGMSLENDFWTNSHIEVVELAISYTLRWGFRKSMSLLLNGLVNDSDPFSAQLFPSQEVGSHHRPNQVPLGYLSTCWAGRLCQMIVKTSELVNHSLFVPFVGRFEGGAWVSLPGMSALSPGMQQDRRDDRCDWQ